MKNNYCVIMAGGIGSRFWPMSRNNYPKQFIDILGSGKTLIRQTYERFLLKLPKVMTYDLKCEVLRHFMEEYTPKDEYELDVNVDDWEKKLTPLVKQIIEKAYTAQLPIEVERKLHWLGEGDMIAAQDN